MADNIGVIKDPSILIKPSVRMIAFIKEHTHKLTSTHKIPDNIKAISENKEGLLQLKDIQWLQLSLRKEHNEIDLLQGEELDEAVAQFMKNKDNMSGETVVVKKFLFLNELLQGCDIVLPKNEVVPRNPVLAARVARLEKQQAERDYQAMIRNVNTSKKFIVEDTVAYQMNMMNRHLIGVAQLILSIAAGFAFGFLGVQLMLGDLEFGFRLLLGISCAGIIGVAEMYFLVKHLNEDYVESTDKEKTPFQLSANGIKPHND